MSLLIFPGKERERERDKKKPQRENNGPLQSQIAQPRPAFFSVKEKRKLSSPHLFVNSFLFLYGSSFFKTLKLAPKNQRPREIRRRTQATDPYPLIFSFDPSERRITRRQDYLFSLFLYFRGREGVVSTKQSTSQRCIHSQEIWVLMGCFA